MLASITPLGERGRHMHWGLTVSAFLLGAGVAGAALGAALGAVGSLLPTLDVRERDAALALAALVALAIDAGPLRVPGPDRQVNERWLDEYRGWVYGLGFGAQLGLGVTTIVSSAATYLALLAALLSGGAGRGALIAGAFGVVRGLTPLAAARVRGPEQLMAMHRRFRRWRAPASLAVRGMLGAILAVGVAGSLA
jgi:hypothetical protein